MKLYCLLLILALAATLRPAPARAQEAGNRSDWERVEPEKPPAEEPPAAQGKAGQRVALCAQLGESVAQLAAMRDHGFTREMAMKRLDAASANQAAKDFTARNIEYVYAHPELKPDAIGKRIEERCERMSQ